MKEEKLFAALGEVWKRVEKSRKTATGSARLMPRRDPPRPERFAPPRRQTAVDVGGAPLIFSACPG